MSEKHAKSDHDAQLDALFGDDTAASGKGASEQDWAAVARQHEQLKAAFQDMETPSDDAFADMRQRVLSQVKPRAKVVPIRRRLVVWASLAAAVVLAFFVGQQWHNASQLDDRFLLEASPQSLVRHVRQNANTGDQLGNTRQLPYRYANVRLEPLANQQIQLYFDLVRSVEVAVDRDDPLVGDLLVHSLMSPSTVASRLKAVQMAGTQLQPRVRKALVVTMLEDENFAVRERALQRLAPYIDDAKVSDAFLALLKSDDNVQLRLLALDVLSKHPGSDQSLKHIADGFNAPTDLPLLMEMESR